MRLGQFMPGVLAGGLAIDLGTANTLIYSRKGGIVCNEPSDFDNPVWPTLILTFGPPPGPEFRFRT